MPDSNAGTAMTPDALIPTPNNARSSGASAVARLSPVDGADPLEDLRRRGLIQEPRRKDWRPRRSGRPIPSAPVSDLVADQRR